MITNNFSAGKCVVLALILSGLSPVAFAEESAYEDLSACVKGEQIKLTAKGAVAGALAGFGGAMFGGKKDDAGKAVLAGGLVGGVAGFAAAYYTSIDTCMKLNPNWIAESDLVRDPGKSYAQVNKENKYNPTEGIKVVFKNVEMANTVKPGAQMPIVSTFDVMTPNGAETPISIGRKLFVVAGGKETEFPFPVKSVDERTVAAGRSKDTVKLPIPPDAQAGTEYRIELSVTAKGKAPVVETRKFTVG